jgi:cytochrome c553
MRCAGFSLLLPAAVLAVVFSAAGRAQDRDAPSYTRHSLAAKIEYCTDCHGSSGQGYRGYYTMPRLAGQQPQYIENQLRAFIERRRTNPIMFNVAHVLSPSMIAGLAAHFRELNPPPVGGAPRHLAAEGKRIFADGLPEANVPACSACHGPEAKGQGEIPRLAGQLYPYLVKGLTNWSSERGQGVPKGDASALMAPIAHNLTQPQVAAVAAYLSALR